MIVLFDGGCGFCSFCVHFIIKRDPLGYFKFASLQSETGKALLKNFNVPSNIDSLVLIKDNKCYLKSTAALQVCKHLNSPWKLLHILIIIPMPIRDFVYEVISKNRYKWFGRNDTCILPTPEQRKRFL
ncbi:thiol-disulfide oxidoreductase DCC family protein [Bacillus sp. DNRA2]|nr:thiol-disulfide oxidoreductase DCC family protein [Bacillus sp. DNRA2]